jgi:CBS domain-containing membrane protein
MNKERLVSEVEEAFDPAVTRALLERLRLTQLLRRFPQRLVWAVFVLINGFLSIAVLSALAMICGTPFVFPSLGPTAFMFFFNPHSPASTPRNALVGHAIGIVCGYGALLVTGLQNAPPTIVSGVHDPRILAAALSLSTTGALMILLRAPHPPAGATTLIVSLGIITKPLHLVVIELAVIVLVLQAFVINRMAGIHYPIWGSIGRRHSTERPQFRR